MRFATWSVTTGTIASRNRAIAITTNVITTTTAQDRFSPRRMKNSTAGLSPTARNIATTISRSTGPTIRNRPYRNQATSRPRPPKNPITNGDRLLNGGPGLPKSSSSLGFAAAEPLPRAAC